MGWRELIGVWWEGLLSVVYPNCCEVCGCTLAHGEDVMCLKCDMEMPRCNIHKSDFNTIHERLAHKVPVERAAGYFYYYRHSDYPKLIHAAKYNGRPRVIRIMARQFATEIEHDGFFAGIDLIVPVPLHRFKRWRRGYNQTEYLAQGLRDRTGIEVARDILLATSGHSTQTRKSAFERWRNSQHIYRVAKEGVSQLEGRHILVVDDVVTSGATMLACCEAIHQAAPTASISVLSLGVTSLQ